jgi:hypothetical protein
MKKMTSVDKVMIPEGLLTVPRGICKKTIDFQGIPVEVEIKVMTNREANEMNEEFTTIIGSDIEVDLTALAEARIERCLLDINTTFKGKEFTTLSESEKKEFCSELHPELKEKIGNIAFAKTHLTKEDKDFLQKL